MNEEMGEKRKKGRGVGGSMSNLGLPWTIPNSRIEVRNSYITTNGRRQVNPLGLETKYEVQRGRSGGNKSLL